MVCYLLTVSLWVQLTGVFSVDSFTVGVWVQLSGVNLAGKQPIICLLTSQLCLYVNNGRLGGQVGQHSVEGSSVLSTNNWYHLAMRYDAESMLISNNKNKLHFPHYSPYSHIFQSEAATALSRNK